jgi:hypothetical protein
MSLNSDNIIDTVNVTLDDTFDDTLDYTFDDTFDNTIIDTIVDTIDYTIDYTNSEYKTKQDIRFLEKTYNKNIDCWEELFDLDDLIDDPIFNVIDNHNVNENMDNKFKKAIRIFKERESNIHVRMNKAISNVSKILKYSSTIRIPSNQLNNIIKERQKYKNSLKSDSLNDSSTKTPSTSSNIELDIDKQIKLQSNIIIETTDNKNVTPNKKLKLKHNKRDKSNDLSNDMANDTINKKQCTEKKCSNIKNNNFYQVVRQNFYTPDGYISDLFKDFFKKSNNTHDFLQNIFPDMNIDEVLSLEMKTFLNKIDEKKMTRMFVIYWFRDFVKYFSSLSGIKLDIHTDSHLDSKIDSNP